MANKAIHEMRENYESSILLETSCASNPFIQFDKWFKDAVEGNSIEPNAMSLATVGKDGQPSVRIVLLKSYSDDGFVFYTNYNSHKGTQMQENEKVALLFWWQERQVRIEGSVRKNDRESAEAYFHSRPKESQIGALVSEQSKVVANRAVLDTKYEDLLAQYKTAEVPLPDYWGGYIVTPTFFEFWQGRVSRLHDRIAYKKISDGGWTLERLAP